MVGNWKVNILLGIAAFLLTYCFSFPNNTWVTSLLRAVIGFLSFFVLGYLIRLILGFILSLKNTDSTEFARENTSSNLEQESTDEKSEMGVTSFQSVPLNALHQMVEDIDSEKVEKVIRTWIK